MNSIFIKAMLDCYKHIDKLADALDKRVTDIALKSSGFDGSFLPASHYVRAITDLTNQKIDLINIKVVIMDMIKSLPYRYRIAARYRYIENLKIREIARFLGVSSRSVFRLLERTPIYCDEYLTKRGFDDEWFINNFSNKQWMSKRLKNNTPKETLKGKPIKEYAQICVIHAQS
ncbi:MAG TPA: sigma-70 region 4 domain-containing protein [Clostridia bacterium]